MLSAIMLSVIMLIVIMAIVVAPPSRLEIMFLSILEKKEKRGKQDFLVLPMPRLLL
jgi:hypothetical protein